MVRIAISMMIVGVFALCGPGCSSQDPVGVRITVDERGSGKLAVAAMTVPKSDIFEPGASEGIVWDDAVKLQVSTGDFESLSSVRIHDLEVDSVNLDSETGSIRLRIPRGTRAVWFRHLHVPKSARSMLRESLQESVQELDLHENVTLIVEILGARVAGSLLQPVPRVSVSAKRDTVTMVAPLEVLEENADDLVLVINWERPKSTASTTR